MNLVSKQKLYLVRDWIKLPVQLPHRHGLWVDSLVNDLGVRRVTPLVQQTHSSGHRVNHTRLATERITNQHKSVHNLETA